jgi:hypothetical protein
MQRFMGKDNYTWFVLIKNWTPGRWLTSAILATQEVEVGRIEIHGQLGQKVRKTPSQPISWAGAMYLLSQLLGRHKTGGKNKQNGRPYSNKKKSKA